MAEEPSRTEETLRVSLKRNTRGLDIIQSVYAFAVALGLTDVYEGSKTLIGDMAFGTSAGGSGLLSSMLLMNVVLLGLRFFWVPRNLGDLVFRSAECESRDPDADKATVSLSNLSITIHLLMILAHGTMFFLLCSEFENVVFLTSSSLPLDASAYNGYVVIHLALLLMNAAWIGLIKIQQRDIERRMRALDQDVSAGSFWWLNNLISSVVGFAPFAVFASCQPDLHRCLAGSGVQLASIQNLAPLSTYQLASIFQLLVDALTWLGLTPSSCGLFWVLAVLLVNSAIDLLTTGKYYLFFEDVEWERRTRRIESGSVSPPVS